MRVRFGVCRTQLAVALDPDNGKNDDRRGLIRRVRTAEAPLVGEFYNGAHVGGDPSSATCRAADPCPDAPRVGVKSNKRHARLTFRYVSAVDFIGQSAPEDSVHEQIHGLETMDGR